MKDWTIKSVRIKEPVTVQDVSDELLVSIVKNVGLGPDTRDYVQEIIRRYELILLKRKMK